MTWPSSGGLLTESWSCTRVSWFEEGKRRRYFQCAYAGLHQGIITEHPWCRERLNASLLGSTRPKDLQARTQQRSLLRPLQRESRVDSQ